MDLVVSRMIQVLTLGIYGAHCNQLEYGMNAARSLISFFAPIRHRPFRQVDSVVDFTSSWNVLALVKFLILKLTSFDT